MAGIAPRVVERRKAHSDLWSEANDLKVRMCGQTGTPPRVPQEETNETAVGNAPRAEP